tara:strand:+ start:3333 stop:3917 length:585 start_codon:yes stop_codon:yes gene_type:complete
MAGLLENEEAEAIEQMPEEMSGQMVSDNQLETDGDDFKDPALQKSIAYIGDRLYGQEKLAGEIAKTLGQSDLPMPEIVASTAYALAQAADEASDGMVREENLSVLGILALNEVFTIAETAGMPLEIQDVSAAMKQLVLMYGKDNGLSQEEIEVLSQGMMQVDDAEFAQAAMELPDEFGESIPEAIEEEAQLMEV